MYKGRDQSFLGVDSGQSIGKGVADTAPLALIILIIRLEGVGVAIRVSKITQGEVKQRPSARVCRAPTIHQLQNTDQSPCEGWVRQ